MDDNELDRRFTTFVLLVSLTLLLGLLSLSWSPASLPEVRADSAGLFLVDHDGDASGQPCTSGTDDDCSLRSAIEHANSGAGADSIIFESGDMAITLGSPLPALVDDDTIIGPLDTSQVIQIDANGVNGNVFEITGDNISLAYLRIYGSGTGWANVWIHGSAQGITIANNVIGDDNPSPGGCGNSSESHSGIFVSSTGSTPAGARAWIYGNVIKCNGKFGDGEGHGIVLDATDGVVIGDDGSGLSLPDEQNEINANVGHGVLIENGASDNTVWNSRVLSNDGSGVYIANSDTNRVDDNEIDGNNFDSSDGDAGIAVDGGDSNQIVGNLVSDTHGGSGIELRNGADLNQIGCPLGGSSSGASRNVVRGNEGPGIRIAGDATNGNYLLCNWIGIADDGTSAAPNGGPGMLIEGAANNNAVGGTVELRNVISGNEGDGILIRGAATDRNLVSGNYIGTNPDGDTAIPNGGNGVMITSGASENTIGSDSDFDARNLISGNDLSGVRVVSSGASGNVIDANSIGTDGAREIAIPNGLDGVTIVAASGTVVGSSSSAPEQVIANNGEAGVFIEGGDNTSVGLPTVIRHNDGAGIAVAGDAVDNDLVPGEVHSNGGLPIDLGNDGHTANDSGDGDAGPNTLLNYPQITDSADSTITGTACAECHVRIYEAVGNPAAPGGGGTLVTIVSADAGGSWSASLAFGLTRYDVTVMARDTSGNTSEMAPRGQLFLPLTVRES